MFDIKWICENPKKFDEGLTKRNLLPQSTKLIAMDEVRRSAQTRAQKIQTERNAISKQIGLAKSKGEDTTGLIQKVSESKRRDSEYAGSRRSYFLSKRQKTTKKTTQMYIQKYVPSSVFMMFLW